METAHKVAGSPLLQLATAIGACLAGVCSVAGLIAIIFGWVLTGQTASHDIADFKAQLGMYMSQSQQQYNSISVQVSSLAAKVDQGPRPDDLKAMDRHLSALDGRVDSQDSRLRNVEAAEAANAATIQGIDAASRIQLQGHAR